MFDPVGPKIETARVFLEISRLVSEGRLSPDGAKLAGKAAGLGPGHLQAFERMAGHYLPSGKDKPLQPERAVNDALAVQAARTEKAAAKKEPSLGVVLLRETREFVNGLRDSDRSDLSTQNTGHDFIRRLVEARDRAGSTETALSFDVLIARIQHKLGM